MWFVARQAHSKPQCFGDSRDSKNDSIWASRREMQRRIPPCTEPAWALQTAKGTGPICEKPSGNQGFLAERTGTEQPAKSIGKSTFQNEASQHPTRALTTSHALASHRLTNSPCSELLVLHRKISQLAGLIARWSFLLENRSQRARVLPTVTGEEFYAQNNRHLD